MCQKSAAVRRAFLLSGAGGGKMNNKFYRWLFYIVGMLLLALGIVLNTKSRLGMAPILSAVFCLSQVYGLNFSNLTLGFYILLVTAQFVIKGRNRRWLDLLQIPLSIVFTRFMNLFSGALDIVPELLWQKLLVCAAAVVVTGVGVTMAVNMRLVPNPGDGIVQAISDRAGISLGLAKNLFDGGCAVLGLALGLLLRGSIIGLGLGTIINILGTGRVVAGFSRLVKKKMMRLAFGPESETAK